MLESLNCQDQFPQNINEVRDCLRLHLQEPLIPLPDDAASFAAAASQSLEPFTVRTINSVNDTIPSLRHLAASATVAHSLSSLAERGIAPPHAIEMVSPVHLFSFANNTGSNSLERAKITASTLHALTCDFLTTFFPKFTEGTIPLPLLVFDNPQAIGNLLALAQELLPQLPQEIINQIDAMAKKYSDGLVPQERTLRSLVYLLSHKDFYVHTDNLKIFPTESDLLLALPRSEEPFIEALPALADHRLNGSSRQTLTTFMAPIRRAHYLFGQRTSIDKDTLLRGEPNLVGVSRKPHLWPSKKRVGSISIPPDHRAELFLAAMLLDHVITEGDTAQINQKRKEVQKLVLKHLDHRALKEFDLPPQARIGGWGYD
ncbi:MAG: hypothetical protein HY381_01200 [Candidatus Chisholmbacteria bacterium]|nr:hypothetical protein [Candidatus Chisholmbacteria bacterium]